MEPEARLAELIASLALSAESAAGVPADTSARAAMVAVLVAEKARLSVEQRVDAFYASLLRYIGCTSYAVEMASLQADDIALLGALATADTARPDSVARRAGRGLRPLARVATVAKVLSDPAGPRKLAAAHCAQAVALASELGLPRGVVRASYAGRRFSRFMLGSPPPRTSASFIGDHVGALARTVAGTALVLSAMAGDDPGDPNALPVSLPPLGEAVARENLRGVRIGIPRRTMWGLLDPDVAAAAERALVVLGELGAELHDIDLPETTPVLGLPGSLGYFSYVLEESRHAHRAARAAHPEGLGPDLAYLYGMPEQTASMMMEALEVVRAYAVAVRRALATVDLLVCPTVPVAAPPLGAETVEIAGHLIPFIAAGLSNTTPFNVARVPAISVPCGRTPSGLPVGLQLAGRPLGEQMVLGAAAAYEHATPWGKERPAV